MYVYICICILPRGGRGLVEAGVCAQGKALLKETYYCQKRPTKRDLLQGR